jgi:biotin synthase
VESVQEIAELICTIKNQTALSVALCLDERPYDVYAVWRQAGADEYLLPHECCNPELYARIHPGQSPATRLARYLWLSGLGYRVTGGMRTGLPEQSLEEVADDLEVMRNSNLTGVMLYPMQDEADILRVTAITRLCLPEADIGLMNNDPLLQARALAYGANLVTTAEIARAEMATAP